MKTTNVLNNKGIEQAKVDKANIIAMQTGTQAEKANAYNQLYKRYNAPIFYEVMKYVRMNKELSEDLTQEIFVKLFEKASTFDFSVQFSTWLYNVAKNHVIDHKRKHKVEVLSVETLSSEFGGDEDVSDVAFQLEDKSADTMNMVIKAERATAVLDALNNGVQSEDGRQILTLIYLDDMAYDKVAELKKMPIGTVKAIMFRAKGEMLKYLSVKSRDFEYGRVCKKRFKAVEADELEVA